MSIQKTDSQRYFGVRPSFLLGFVGFIATLVAIIYLPDLLAHNYFLKILFLMTASVSIIVGWLLLIRYPTAKNTARAIIALFTSIYLTLSVPTFLVEISQIKWLVLSPRHREFSMYVWPWAHLGLNGFLFVLAGVIGTCFGRGPARIAFFVGSVLLLVLRAATGTWMS